jgi:hypothetical protein
VGVSRKSPVDIVRNNIMWGAIFMAFIPFLAIEFLKPIENSNSKFRNSVGVRHWPALTPSLSQVWEREQKTKLFAPAPLLSELGEGVGG